MTTRILVLLAIPAVLLGQSPSRRTGNDSLPTPHEIEMRIRAALGGSSHPTYWKEEMAIEGQEARVHNELWRHSSKLLLRLTVPGFGMTETGTNGTVGWSRSPLTGASLLDSAQLKEFMRFKSTDDLAEYTEFRVEGIRVIEARSAYVLAGGADSNQFMVYVDVATSLPMGMDFPGRVPVKDAPFIRMREYARVEGRMVAMVMETHAPSGPVMRSRKLKVSFKPVDPSVFEPPSDVRALLARRSP